MRVWALAVFTTGMATVIYASTWIEFSNPRFQIVTDAGESAARQLVTDLEQFDGAIAHSAGSSSPAIGPASGPVRIYVFRDEREFSEFRKEPWSAGATVTRGTSAAPFIVMFAGTGTRAAAIHEYVHVLARRGDWKLPHWFGEGLAELYGHSQPIGRDRLSIGQRLPEHLAQLRGQLIEPSMFVLEPRPDTHLRYYAASWALVHMMLMDPEHRALTERLMATGTWDASFAKLLTELQAYIARPIWNEATVGAPRSPPRNVSIKVIPPLDAEFMLAELLLDVGRPDASAKRYQRIVAAHPKDSASPEAAGFAALASGQLELARKEFHRAVDLKSTRARVWSDLAALDHESGVAWPEVKKLLERASELDPADFQAALSLGVHESDDGMFPAAVEHLGAAAKAAPGRTDVWHAYAWALSKSGSLDEARLAAKRALRVASTPEWESMASDLVTSLEKGGSPAGATRRGPEVVTSSAWSLPKPDSEVAGQFVEFVCEGDHPRFKILDAASGQLIELRVENPKQVAVLTTGSGESSIELKCGPQDRRPIRVGFRKFDGTVLEVKFPQVHDLKRF